MFRTAEQLFTFPTRTFHIRMLERETGLSTTAVADAVAALVRFGIARTEKGAVTLNVKADVESRHYRQYNAIFNLYRLQVSGFRDDLLEMFPYASAIVLFGSFAKGEDAERSDIDVLVVSSEKQPSKMETFRGTYRKAFQRDISMHVLPSLEKSSGEFRNAAANGIVLHGYLKVA